MNRLNQRPWLCLLALVLAASSAGCRQEESIVPPQIRFGEDVCDVCHMIVSDERFAAGLVTVDERGRLNHLMFDDIGCVFEYEAAQPHASIVGRFVHDYEGGGWLDAETAEYIHSREIQSPMAFGLAAVSDLAAARIVHERYGGDMIDLAEARRRFQSGTLSLSSLDDAQGSPVLLINARTIDLPEGHALEVLLNTPQQLPPGKHPLEVKLNPPGANGIDDAMFAAYALEIEPAMPSMGHGSPGNEHPVHAGGGVYRGVVNFTMSGHWTVTVTVRREGNLLGRATFDFEVSS